MPKGPSGAPSFSPSSITASNMWDPNGPFGALKPSTIGGFFKSMVPNSSATPGQPMNIPQTWLPPGQSMTPGQPQPPIGTPPPNGLSHTMGSETGDANPPLGAPDSLMTPGQFTNPGYGQSMVPGQNNNLLSSVFNGVGGTGTPPPITPISSPQNSSNIFSKAWA